MLVFGFSLDNLSLMALTIAVGFVVDDAIVMVEMISRHIEAGEKPFDAALRGRERNRLHHPVDHVSLIAVFIPLLFMGGIVGRLMREFAVTLSDAIVVSIGGVADADADDGRRASCAQPRRNATWPVLPAGAARLRRAC